MPLALILVDALSAAYASQATLPVLYDLAGSGFIGPLANIYAYRGIEATLFTGLFPADHGVWGEFRPGPATYAPEAWPDRVTRLVIEASDLIPSDRLRLDVRYVVSRLRHPNHRLPTGNLIPAQLMPLFTTSVERPIWEPRSLGEIKTIFDELRVAGKSFATVLYPAIQHDYQVEAHVRAQVARGPLPDFWYIKFSALDALGHRFGPNVAKLAPALREFNGQLVELISTLKSAYTNADIDIVILSDHGMSQVHHRLDVRPMLKQASAAPGHDFLYFLDSTTIRLWSNDPRTRAVLTARFADVPGLRLLDHVARQSLHIPDDTGTGDVLIALSEGAVIFPDFFRRVSPPVGMHGYAFVETEAGLPFLAVEAEMAACLPSHRLLTHADVWAAMRQRLGLAELSYKGEA